MDRKKLADELRQGNAWRYADGLVAIMGKNALDKSAATDWELVKAASTCHSCFRSATNEEIEQAEEEAHDYASFAALIVKYIEHAPECDSDLVYDDEEYEDEEEDEDEE